MDPAAARLADHSFELLRAVRYGDSGDRIVRMLATCDDSEVQTLAEYPDTATAFWINCYNAFVQRQLRNDPTLLDDRSRFFEGKRITIAGTALSLDDIEHGILRSSKWKYGLGYIPRPFPSTFEQSHRLQSVDPRIHFALNCGATSCPPIVAYTATGIEEELDIATESFLQSTVERPDSDTIRISRLFLYYRGDFGGRSGIYTFLERYGVLEPGDRPRVRYQPYDWSLRLNQYRRQDPKTGQQPSE